MKNFLLITGSLVLGALSLQSCGEDDTPILNREGNDALLITSNTSGLLTKIETADINDQNRKDIPLGFNDSDGITVRGDDAYIVDRSNNRLLLLDDVFDEDNEAAPKTRAAGNAQVVNGRGIAINQETLGSDLAVGQDANADNMNANKIYRYRTQNKETDYLAEVNVPFNVWGLEFDGTTLIAVVDNSDSIAVYENFDNAENGDLDPTYYLQVRGITRTHGITFDKRDNIMILTDIGDAGSDSDGALIVIRDWRSSLSAAKNVGFIDVANHTRLAGPNSLLGNPVDVAYDVDKKRVYVAERAKDGGRVLGYDTPTASGDLTPVVNIQVAGASSVAYRN